MRDMLFNGRRAAAGALLLAASLAGCLEPAESKPGAQEGCAPGTAPSENGQCVPAGLPEASGCAPGTWAPEGDGVCVPAGLPAQGLPCPPGEWPRKDGVCAPAGVPPEACGEGFSAADGGCDPVLPEGPCGAGLLAIPGESACHEVSPCGESVYGDAPVEASTQFVDNSYAGGDSDGTSAKPWTSVQAAIDAAAPGAAVAIAAGTYEEDLVVADKAVRLWGRCPSLVTVSGDVAALEIVAGDGSEVRGIGFTGAGNGVKIAGSDGVSLSRVWVHDTGARGIVVALGKGAPSTGLAIEDSLVEGANDSGVLVNGSGATLRRSVVRGTAGSGYGVMALPSPGLETDLSMERCVVEDNGNDGVGASGSTVSIASSVVRSNMHTEVGVLNDGERRSTLTMTASVVEGAELAGVYARGSDVTLEAVVARDDAWGTGAGVYLERDLEAGESATASISGSLIAHNHHSGIAVYGSTATIVGTAVRDTELQDEMNGVGISAIGGADGGARAKVTVKGCEVADSRLAGILAAGSDLTVEGTAVLRTDGIPYGGEGNFLGSGIEVSEDNLPPERGVATILGSLVEDTHEGGIVVTGSDCTVLATTVRGTLPQPRDSKLGRGVHAQPGRTGARSNVTLRASVVEDNHDAGVFVLGSDALLEGVVVQRTSPSPGEPAFGAGVVSAVGEDPEISAVTVRGSVIAECRAAGAYAQGGALVVEDTWIHDTLPEADKGEWGRGALARSDDAGNRGDLTLRRSLVENSVGFGVGVYGADAVIEATEIRATAPNPESGEAGVGLQVWNRPEGQSRAIAEVTSSLITGSHATGVLVGGADVALWGVRVEGTVSEVSTGFFGRGIGVQYDADTEQRAEVEVHDCAVIGNQDVGIFVAGSDALIAHTLVEATSARAKDGLFGDGVVAIAYGGPASLSIESSWIKDSERAGLAVFGSSASVKGARIQCASFAMENDPYAGEAPSLTDLGDNLCGCPEADTACHAESTGITPPEHQEDPPGS